MGKQQVRLLYVERILSQLNLYRVCVCGGFSCGAKSENKVSVSCKPVCDVLFYLGICYCIIRFYIYVRLNHNTCETTCQPHDVDEGISKRDSRIRA